MLKIVGGKHRGRALMAPEGSATRPAPYLNSEFI